MQVIAGVGKSTAWAGAAVALAVAAMCVTSAAAAWRGGARTITEGICFSDFVERVAIAKINCNVDKTVGMSRDFHGDGIAVYNRYVCSGNAADGYFGDGGSEGGVTGSRGGYGNGRIYCCAISELTVRIVSPAIYCAI